jgi:hypothetical protein
MSDGWPAFQEGLAEANRGEFASEEAIASGSRQIRPDLSRLAVRIVWTKRYLRELEGIGDYIAEHSPGAAARVVNEIHSKTGRLLSTSPFIGRPGEIRARASW